MTSSLEEYAKAFVKKRALPRHPELPSTMTVRPSNGIFDSSQTQLFSGLQVPNHKSTLRGDVSIRRCSRVSRVSRGLPADDKLSISNCKTVSCVLDQEHRHAQLCTM